MKITSETSGLKEAKLSVEGTVEEIAALKAVALGVKVIVDKYAPAPDPVEDPYIPPKFELPKVPPVGTCTERDLEKREYERLSVPKVRSTVVDMFERDEGFHFPGFMVSSITAWSGAKTAEEHISVYRREAKKLLDAGFECLRSRRGRDGRYTEVWWLGSAAFAEGQLKEIVSKYKSDRWREMSRDVIDWLIENVRFGSADVVVQRAALCAD